MVNDLIALLFFSRDYAHRAHLKTTSHARHMALDTFYKEMPELIDSLVESYQGRFKVIDIGYYSDPGFDVNEPTVALAKIDAMVRLMRYEAIPRAETMLQNQVDEIEVLLASTLYKLKRFA